MIKARKAFIYGMIVMGCFINTGTIRKNFDAIRNTQTDAVSWKQVEEQIKDGEKAAPKPSFKFYFFEKFQVTPPLAVKAPVENAVSKDTIPSYGSPIPESAGGESRKETKGENWWAESWEKNDPSGPQHASNEKEPASEAVESGKSDGKAKSDEAGKKEGDQFWQENW